MSTSANSRLRRGLRILKALKGKSLYGLSNRELAKALGESEVNVTRAMDDLIAEGMVQRLETGRYAPGMQLLFIAQAFSNEMAVGQARIAELNQRVIAGSHN
ncbi:IclR family transcriptional regulator [Salmonella enterica]|uniref:helix-turn-helix domain-containing protein n=1 Tax=Salmonella enterica TaxID=28901 RepID=UPI000F9D2B73|nr:IclR family transcriptional regulator [Salmonella enterica]EAS0615016.1 IclR family transcriptional regulator [Salmonella enterica subsp. enterica serovar Dahomey]EBQ9004287.1 IclR family transcriptional regulator [Salmonella enterica subsp. enterica serovar Blockley]EBW2603692.1 IclR family transcriptional regulator [Salmonella enterica subsp. enterica serovar Poano]EBY7079427.1 IclR family transcriptional regulator [Salmonella enterica subsp. enterica serovar Ealing]ECA5248067.1 IclR fami